MDLKEYEKEHDQLLTQRARLISEIEHLKRLSESSLPRLRDQIFRFTAEKYALQKDLGIISSEDDKVDEIVRIPELGSSYKATIDAEMNEKYNPRFQHTE